jgi:hypothetical protein
MAYVPPITRTPPTGKLCDYGCGQLAGPYWFKTLDKYCCSSWANSCPAQKAKHTIRRGEIKELKDEHGINSMDYIRARYPRAYAADFPDGTMRFNEETKKVELRCTHFDCKKQWYEAPYEHINLREWALTPQQKEDESEDDSSSSNRPTQGGDGYKYYCSQECRDLCAAHGKTGAIIYREVVMQHMIDWEEDEEWYGADVSTSDKNLWRETCLIRDNFMCIRCATEPAVHVHHEHPVKTHPMEVVDPVNGLSVCSRCHYDHFHKRGSICSIPNLVKKVCYSIVNGEAKRLKDKSSSPPPLGVLSF